MAPTRAGEIMEGIGSGVGLVAMFGTILAGLWLGYTWFPYRQLALDLEDSKDGVEMTGASGHKWTFEMTGYGLASKWASPTGLTLDFNGTEIALVGPKERNWDDSIVYNQRNRHEFEIREKFRLPPVNETSPATVQGHVVGSLLRPRASGGGFHDETVPVQIPVAWHVVTQEAADALRMDANRIPIVALLVAAPLFVVAIATVLVVEARKRKH